MGIFDGMAQGLRAAGSVFSPEVGKQLETERLADSQNMEGRRKLIAAQIISGIESGSVPVEAGTMQLKALGYGDVPVGESVAAQKARSEMERTKRVTAVLAGQDATQTNDVPGMVNKLINAGGLAEAHNLATTYRAMNPSTEVPQLVRLQQTEQALRARGDTVRADQIAAQITKLNSTENSKEQEQMNFLLETKRKAHGGERIGAEEMAKAKMIYRLMTSPKVDLATGASYAPQIGEEFDPFRDFGIKLAGAPAPGAAPGAVPRDPNAPKPVVTDRGTYTPGEAKPGEGEIKIASESDALRGHLEDLDKLFKPNFVGPISGRIGQVQAKVGGKLWDGGPTAISSLDKNESDFRAQSALYKNRLIKFITGAQMSEFETERIINEIPDVNDTPATWKSKRDISEKNIDYVMKAYQENQKRAGIRQIGRPVGSPIPTSAVVAPPGTPNDGGWTVKEKK